MVILQGIEVTAQRNDENLPLFNLASLETFSLIDFLKEKNSSVSQLIATFAIIHNDLKDLLWFEAFIYTHINTLSYHEISPKAGQLKGMHEHCIRIIHACVWEFLQTIEANISIIKLPDFDTLINLLSKPEYKTWQSIMKSIKSRTELYRTLREIRQNATYHYDKIKCTTIGLKHYIEKKRNDIGYISFGKSPEETRFYFADAAVQYYHLSVSEKYTDQFVGEVKQFIKDVLVCLHAVVEIYFKRNVKMTRVDDP